MFPVPARPGGHRTRRWKTYTNHVLPVAGYSQTQTIPLARAGQSVVSAGGTATVSIGPSGLGAKWYPMTATFATTSGPAFNNGATTVIMYFGFISQATLVDGRQYAGGGDVAGLAIPMMSPGDVIIARWAGGNPGDVAQLTLVGTQDLLVMP